MLKRKIPDAVTSIRHYFLISKGHGLKAHGISYYKLRSWSHALKKQQLYKYWKRTFDSPSKIRTITRKEKKWRNCKNVHFEKKCIHTFPLITTFYNFTLKIETSWARKVVKLVFETWNVNEIIVYVWFVKKSKICNAKKNNSKCRKFSIKLK